ncbi:heavy metal translocating P-type ATPase [Anaeromicrobium sediminis]|uniref:Cd(2+)-exporting ATPase n=1 Tax=Anaeromicrobium sediminis TaxID=1478221 RepID=A0A267MLH6_9FIRM|nr:HAD-IC family P-type ATPase [Anaeromicrobium sediminis]PAB60386.1 hypothetical protein CCE28_05685 [Anaeromicrobium sediminis]
MEQISYLPGRVRYKIPDLYDKSIGKFINGYIDNLYGVKHSKVNHYTSTILIVYDADKTSNLSIQRNIKNAIGLAVRNEHNLLNKYDNHANAIENRSKSKKKLLIYGSLYILFKLKKSLLGRAVFSRNIRLLFAASAITIIGGYPLLRRPVKHLSKKIPKISDLILRLTIISLIFLREDGIGCLILGLKSLNDYIKYSADVECYRLLNKSMRKGTGMACIKDSEGNELLVPVDYLRVDDVISIHKGEISPVEGIVVEGKGIINNLYTTGQTLVTHVDDGDRIYEGSIVVSGELKIRVINLPKFSSKIDTSINSLNIYESVTKYQEKISKIAVGLSIINYCITGSLLNAFSVVLLLCPSSSEVAMSIGVKRYLSLLAKNNIYLRNPNTFEKLLHIDHVLFDKTGTLTYGRMKIIDVETFDKRYSKNELLKICAACEVNHYHPISITIQEETGKDYDLRKLESSALLPSKGIEAVYDNQRVIIGNKELMEENTINISKYLNLYIEYEEKLFTPIFISIDNKLRGMIVLKDTLREESYELIDKLKETNIKNISILSGDTYSKNYDVASKLGIENIYSNCTNENKLEIISKHKIANKVMMVGDGINDITAMNKADISVCLGNSSCDNIKYHSDCIIFEDDISKLYDFISLTEKSYKIITQNINISKLYNMTTGALAFFMPINPFTAKFLNSLGTVMTLLLNKRIKNLDSDKNR